MRILNLYAGIGGNRKLWGDEHEIVAVENFDPAADVYTHFYPQDTLVRDDAHQYLLDHHKEFGFIWSSPPCPTHSRFNASLYAQGYVRYPDMRLYQEIIFLKQFYKGKWAVENVEPYYKPLIHPSLVIDRHCIWSNFYIPQLKIPRSLNIGRSEYLELANHYDIHLPPFVERKHRRLMLRNVADPKIGLHILNAAQKQLKQEVLL